MTRHRMQTTLAAILMGGWTLAGAAPAGAGGGCHDPGPTEGSGQTVALAMNCMTPRVLRAQPGAVTFVNRDEVVHNVVGSAWGADELRPGDSFTETLAAGIHPYSCTLHPGMVGTVVVGDGAGVGTASRATIAAAAVGDVDGTGSRPLVPTVATGMIALGAGVAIGRRTRRIPPAQE